MLVAEINIIKNKIFVPKNNNNNNNNNNKLTYISKKTATWSTKQATTDFQ